MFEFPIFSVGRPGLFWTCFIFWRAQTTIPKKAIILLPVDTLNIFAALLSIAIASTVRLPPSGIPEGVASPRQVMDTHMEKATQEAGVSGSARSRKLCTFSFGSRREQEPGRSDDGPSVFWETGAGTLGHVLAGSL